MYGYCGQWGYYTDAATGLRLLTHRYYDAAAGRFLTRDPISYRGGVNLYSYTGNEPVIGLDAAGLMPSFNPERAQHLSDKLQNIYRDIRKREIEMKDDLQKLPGHTPNEKEKPSTSRKGHRDLIDKLKKRAGEVKEELEDLIGRELPEEPSQCRRAVDALIKFRRVEIYDGAPAREDFSVYLFFVPLPKWLPLPRFGPLPNRTPGFAH
jgi:RHS repeat-associated protein